MKKIVSSILIISLLILSSCQKQEPTRFSAQFLELFDTVTQIVSYSEDKEIFESQVNSIYEDLEEYHQLYDIYNEYPEVNNIKTINDNAGIKPVEVDKRIIDLLKFSKEIYTLTDGTVNVVFGSVLSIWHIYRENGIDDPLNAELPPFDVLKKASEHTDISKLIINEANSTVFLEDPDMLLDVGAIAKGYAVERVSQKAILNGFTSGLISVGGNVRAIGNKPVGNGNWNLGIQNPDTDSENTNIHIVYLQDSSLVTSGNYMRYYTVEGKEYHHIISPDTLFPADIYKAVTIISSDSGIADALSTAIFVLPFEKGLEIIENLDDTEAVWIFSDSSEKYSSSFFDYKNNN